MKKQLPLQLHFYNSYLSQIIGHNNHYVKSYSILRKYAIHTTYTCYKTLMYTHVIPYPLSLVLSVCAEFYKTHSLQFRQYLFRFYLRQFSHNYAKLYPLLVALLDIGILTEVYITSVFSNGSFAPSSVNVST